MRNLLRTLLPVAVLTALLAGAMPAQAETLPTRCVPTNPSSPACKWRKAKVQLVADGDTIDVTEGNGTYRVRSIGINTMEMTVYTSYRDQRRGECHAVAATNRLEDLLRQAGGTVYLAARDLNSTTAGRYRRYLWTRVNGQWRDLSGTLLREGLGLAAPNDDREWVNPAYNYYAQRAAAARVGLYNRSACGVGPTQGARLSMWVNWDADGSDNQNVNGEWVRINNNGTTDVPLGGWWIRDSWVRRYHFPPGTVVRAGRSITLFVGSGRRTATSFFWGRSSSIFANVDGGHSEGGYLFDPQGDMRAWMMYPCRYLCRDRLKGKVSVRAHHRSPEYVAIRNTSARTVNLRGYVLKNPPYTYPFVSNTRIRPGGTVRVYVRGSARNNTATRKYWGKRKDILNAGGDVVSLRTFTDIRIACHRWGSGPRC